MSIQADVQELLASTQIEARTSFEVTAAVPKDKILKAIEAYTERKVTNLEVVPDPRVPNVWAARVNLGPQETIEFLITGWNGKGDIDPDTQLEEVEFKSWPPTSKGASANTEAMKLVAELVELEMFDEANELQAQLSRVANNKEFTDIMALLAQVEKISLEHLHGGELEAIEQKLQAMASGMTKTIREYYDSLEAKEQAERNEME